MTVFEIVLLIMIIALLIYAGLTGNKNDLD
jgi:hypothetical protein